MSPQAELNLRAEHPEFKIIPVVKYQKMWVRPHVQRSAKARVAETRAVEQVKIRILDRKSNEPLHNAHVIAFTNFRFREGAEAKTQNDGYTSLALKHGVTIERLYIYGPTGYWSFFASGITLGTSQDFSLAPVDPNAQASLLENLYGTLPDDAGQGVTVAVVDSGVAQHHPALPVAGGVNLVFDEISQDPNAMVEWGPAQKEGEHGTHVAGIIGARRTPQTLFRGVAPGVTLRSYRVFPNNGEGGDNYDIMNAIIARCRIAATSSTSALAGALKMMACELQSGKRLIAACL